MKDIRYIIVKILEADIVNKCYNNIIAPINIDINIIKRNTFVQYININ